MTASRLLLSGTLALILNCASLFPYPQLAAAVSEAGRDGFIATVATPGLVCAPAQVDRTSELRVGRDPAEGCGEFRSFLSFDVSDFRTGQIAKAELFLYQFAASGEAPGETGTLTADLVDYGLDLDADDWHQDALVTAASGLSPGSTAHEFRIDVTSLLNFIFETGRSRLQFRLRSSAGPDAAGYISLYSGNSAPPELRPRLEVTLSAPVVAPLRMEPIGLSNSADAKTFVGIALANPSARSNRIKTAVYAPDGALVREQDRGLISRNGQQAFVAEPAGTEAMMVARGNVGALQGFFMLGDENLQRLDGVGGTLPESPTLYLPAVRQGTSEDTQLYLFRSTSTLDQEVELTLFNSAGERVTGNSIELTSPGFHSASLAFLLNDESLPDRGYLRISSSEGLQALGVFADRDSLGSLAAVLPGRVKTLYAPHFLLSGDADSEVSLLNLEDSAVDARIRAFDDGGQLLGQRSIQLEGRALLSEKLSELLSLTPPADGLMSGHLVVELDPEEPSGQFAVLGAIAFGADDGSYLSVLPLVGRGSEETLILQVAQSDSLRIFTGLAILNYGDGPAEVVVQAFGKTGGETGRAELSLEPGTRAVGLLNTSDFFGPGFSQVEGHLRITSDRPVVTFAIFGDYELRYLAAIESQVPSTRFEGISLLRGECEGDPGPSIVAWVPDPRQFGPVAVVPGQPQEVELVLWDNSEEPSSLGGLRRGISDVSWDLAELEGLDAVTSEDLQIGISPYSVRARLGISAPAGSNGRAEIGLTATDVSGCTTTIRFPVIVGPPQP